MNAITVQVPVEAETPSDDLLEGLSKAELIEIVNRQAKDNTLLHGRAAADPTGWAEPVDILRNPGAPAFTDEDVPDLIGDYPRIWAIAAGFDPTAAIACATGAVAAALDDSIRLEASAETGWYESARLWIVAFTPPGGGKSPAIKEMTRPIIEQHRSAVEAYIESCKGLKDSDEAPARPAYFTNDCTTEKLSEILKDNPRGVLFQIEEFDSWIGSHDAYRNGGGKDRGEWLQLFDGGPHQVDRVKRGSFFVPNWGVSLLSACTPSALKRYASKLPNDGLLQRVMPFIIAIPTAAKEVPGLDEIRREYYEKLGLILAYEGQRVVRFSDAGKQAFRRYVGEYRELAIACGSINESLAGHVAKYGTLLARLALTFHAAEDYRHPASRSLNTGTVDLAAKFLGKAFIHARAFYAELGGGDYALDLAQRVAKVLLADGFETVDRRTLIQKCRVFRDASSHEQTDAMRLLEDCGWVREMPGEYQKPYATHWEVNPMARTRFAADGESHRQRREVVKAAIIAAHGERDEG